MSRHPVEELLRRQWNVSDQPITPVPDRRRTPLFDAEEPPPVPTDTVPLDEDEPRLYDTMAQHHRYYDGQCW